MKNNNKINLARFLAVFLGMLMAMPLTAKEIGKIGLAIGKVSMRVKGGTWQAVRSGMSISDNTELQTSLRGKAVINMNTGTKITVKPGSMMSFDKFASGSYGTATDVSLKMGRISAAVSRPSGNSRNHFRVRTPTAVAGVRGTEEEIGYSPDLGTEISLFESSADLIGANGQASVVQEGNNASVNESGKMITPEVAMARGQSVIMGNSSMSSDEMSFSVEAGDTMFSGNPQDFGSFVGGFQEMKNNEFFKSFLQYEEIGYEKL